jgi:uncharacterized protein
MRIIDADGHVEENPATFSDKYLDPAFRARRPRIIACDDMLYWCIDEQLFPRRVGRGCNNMGTPASLNGTPARHSAGKPESLESMELTDTRARLQSLDDENISQQVVYPTLFLAYPLSSDSDLMTAMCSSYNRWLGDQLSGCDRIKWAAVVNLNDVPAAVREVREARRLGAVSVVVLGTAGDRQLDDAGLLPFYEAVAAEDLAIGVHVGWSCPSINNLYDHIYPSGVIAFHMPVLMAFTALISGGILDRFDSLRVVFLEAGCLWVPFMVDRLHHRYETLGKFLPQFVPETKPRQLRPVMEYVERGNLYFSAEVEDILLPQVMDLVGEEQIVFGTDMPHGDRERFVARTLQERADLSKSAKANIQYHNPARLYRLESR